MHVPNIFSANMSQVQLRLFGTIVDITRFIPEGCKFWYSVYVSQCNYDNTPLIDLLIGIFAHNFDSR